MSLEWNTSQKESSVNKQVCLELEDQTIKTAERKAQIKQYPGNTKEEVLTRAIIHGLDKVI